MSRVQWMGCDALGCPVQIPLDSHFCCLRHALSTADFIPYDPMACFMCVATVSSLLQQPCLTGLKPQHQHVCRRWADLHKVAHKHGKTTMWADLDLPLMLSFGHTPRVSPSLSLVCLLREPSHPEPAFSGFPPLTTEGTGLLPPPPSPASAPAPSSGSPLCVATIISPEEEEEEGPSQEILGHPT